MAFENIMKLTDIQKYIIYAHHHYKTTKLKVRFINLKLGNIKINEYEKKIETIAGKKLITKTVYYRMLKKMDNDPETRHYTNKGMNLLLIIALTDELEKVNKEYHNLSHDFKKSAFNKHNKLTMKHFQIMHKIDDLTCTPHRNLGDSMVKKLFEKIRKEQAILHQ